MKRCKQSGRMMWCRPAMKTGTEHSYGSRVRGRGYPERLYRGGAKRWDCRCKAKKRQKRYLREFFFVPEGVPAYQETDLMMAVSYLNGVANVLNMPLVICLALGNSMGDTVRTVRCLIF